MKIHCGGSKLLVIGTLFNLGVVASVLLGVVCVACRIRIAIGAQETAVVIATQEQRRSHGHGGRRDDRWCPIVMGRFHRPRCRDERGTALVETALVLPLTFALLLGVFTGGRAYFTKISVADASRGGARFAASLKLPTGGIPAWRQSVQDRVAQQSGGTIQPGQVCADLVVPTGSNASCGVADPAGAASDPTSLAPASVVKVSVVTSSRLEFVFFTSTTTSSTKVAARYERDIV